jgi:hypothetical protein
VSATSPLSLLCAPPWAPRRRAARRPQASPRLNADSPRERQQGRLEQTLPARRGCRPRRSLLACERKSSRTRTKSSRTRTKSSRTRTKSSRTRTAVKSSAKRSRRMTRASTRASALQTHAVRAPGLRRGGGGDAAGAWRGSLASLAALRPYRRRPVAGSVCTSSTCLRLWCARPTSVVASYVGSRMGDDLAWGAGDYVRRRRPPSFFFPTFLLLTRLNI